MSSNKENTFIARCAEGFTLVELIVVMSIIALLMSILLPALGKARKMAKQVVESSNLRQILLAYTYYYTDNDGHLLYGYMPQSVDGRTYNIHDKNSGYTYGAPIVNRYPWRLVPYLEEQWEVLFSNSKKTEIPSSGDSQDKAFRKAYKLSIQPSFGLNSIYVGGHYSPFYKGFIDNGSTARPNYGQHVVFKAQDVRTPSNLIVFTESKMFNYSAGDNSREGFFYATPPFANGHMWRSTNGKFEVLEKSRLLGLPQGRYTNKTITGFFDGHVSILSPKELEDMQKWSNRAKGQNGDFID